MNKVLIVSRTKMQNDMVCVSGIDLENGTPIRLFNHNGYHESKDECPYNIKDIWNIDYCKINIRPLPHSEDVRVLQRNFIETLPASSMCDAIRDSGATIYTGNIGNVFEGKIIKDEKGKLYINNDNVPQNSTCSWISDHVMSRNDYNGKVRYRYKDFTNQWGYSIPFVGFENPLGNIPAGTLLRLSLAHWWKPENSEDEERCYLQLSGWYM